MVRERVNFLIGNDSEGNFVTHRLSSIAIEKSIQTYFVMSIEIQLKSMQRNNH